MAGRSRNEAVVKLGGSYGAKTSLVLGIDAPLELWVYGVTDEVAARVLLGDTQIGVGKRKSSSDGADDYAEQSIPVSVLTTSFHRSLEPVELVIELGKAPVHHARTGAEQSFEWREVARLTVHPEWAQLASQVAAAVPLAAGGWALVEGLSNIGRSSAGRMALDAIVLVTSAVPIVLATRDRARGASRWRRSWVLSLLAAAFGVPAMLLEQSVENRVAATISEGGTAIPSGWSRWLPREFEARRAGLEQQHLIVERVSRQLPCVASRTEVGPRPGLFEPWYIARASSLRAVDRNLIGVLPLADRSLCDGRSSTDSVCCIETGEGAADRSTGDFEIPTRQRTVRRTIHVRWRPSSTPLDVEGLGANSFTLYAWNNVAFRGATRTLRDVESRWIAEPPARELALDGFSPEAQRAVSVTLESGRSIDVRCPVASSTGHFVRATSPTVRGLVIGGARFPLSTQDPTVICANSGEVKLVLDGAGSELSTPFALPFHSQVVTIVERRGDQEVTIGRTYCPTEAGRHVSVVSLRTAGFERIERIERLPNRDQLLWDSPADVLSPRVFLCVATDYRGVPTQEPVSQLRPLAFEHVRVAPHGAPSTIAMLYRGRLFSLVHVPLQFPPGPRCCFDANTGTNSYCPIGPRGRPAPLGPGVIRTRCLPDGPSDPPMFRDSL